MKNLHIISILLLIISCGDSKNKIESLPQTRSGKVTSKSAKVSVQNPVMQKWLRFYQHENPNFAEKNFKLTATSPINYQPANVKMMNEKGFNEIYKRFFVFNETGTKYLDFDSYHWSLAPDGEFSFEADQQVALVNLKTKTAQQIAFFGPSFNVEEAYWENDSVAVLLGNTYEKVPFLLKFNFKKNSIQHFQYPDTLKFATSYYETRLTTLIKK